MLDVFSICQTHDVSNVDGNPFLRRFSAHERAGMRAKNGFPGYDLVTFHNLIVNQYFDVGKCLVQDTREKSTKTFGASWRAGRRTSIHKIRCNKTRELGQISVGNDFAIEVRNN